MWRRRRLNWLVPVLCHGLCPLEKQGDIIAEADAVSLNIRGSKTDKYNADNVQNWYESGDSFCPVRVMAEIARRCPARFAGEEEEPLFTHSDGEPVACEEVSLMVQAAGLVFGILRVLFNSHSLKRGEASAAYQGSTPIPRIQRL